MNETPLMKCGHNGMARDGKTGKPCCAICWNDPNAYIVDNNPPTLTGRIARCSYYGHKVHRCECDKCSKQPDGICHCEKPSSDQLAFFVYKGPGSHNVICKNCHFIHEGECPTHYKGNRGKPGKEMPGHEKWAGKSYEPISTEFDEYYCGCMGWD